MSGTAATRPAAGVSGGSLVRDLVMLTKPRIISLLLVTTIAPMYVVGEPPWLLVLVVCVGGYLMAGGANAVNMYLDRDIDDRMARTRRRPIPSGRLGATAVIAFGVLLATAGTWLLAHFANVLAAALALAGFYFYVFVYTRWLKRTTPQNIVIGGAAGAFPPLVGVAAVTGRVDLLGVYLFLIVFYWTPPHFWALALRIRGDYAAAGVPMLPVVRGIAETSRQIGLYTILLVALTVVFAVVANMGAIYAVAAAVLGALFLWRAYVLWRQGTSPDASTAQAIRLYRYSITYLTVLFAAVALDTIWRV